MPSPGNDTVNIAEKAEGFAISGDTGTEAGVTVTLKVGTATLSATSADDNGMANWSVSVPAGAVYITGTSVVVTVSAAKTGFTAPADVQRTLIIDLTAPAELHGAGFAEGGRGDHDDEPDGTPSASMNTAPRAAHGVEH